MSEIVSYQINGKDHQANEKKNILFFANLPNSITLMYADGRTENVEVNLNFSENVIDNISELANGDEIKFIMDKTILGENLMQIGESVIENPCHGEIRDGMALSQKQFELIYLESINSSNCYHVYLKDLPQQSGLILNLTSRHLSGQNLTVIIDNPQQKSNILESKLNDDRENKYLIIPPTSRFLYSDYGFHIRNESPGSTKSLNSIGNLSASYFPYNWLRNFKLISGDVNLEQSKPYIFEELINDIHPYMSILKLDINTLSNNNGIIYLSQSFNTGWLAYQIKNDPSNIKMFIRQTLPFLYGKRLEKHVLVNNWANGWKLNKETVTRNSNVILIFWPQYLQFIGFFLLIGGLIYILGFKSNSKQ